MIAVSDAAGTWRGGITAEVYWDWLEIQDFWLDESYRGQGLGRALLAQMEGLAIERDAAKALLSTFAFQARTFYERWGYEVVGEVEDYPPGSSLFTMVKQLCPR